MIVNQNLTLNTYLLNPINKFYTKGKDVLLITEETNSNDNKFLTKYH